MKNDKKGKITTRFGRRNWSVLLIIGLFGQIAWIIENMYFNVFVYKTITDDPSVIATMVAASAVAATITTLVMGTLSDHLGKRKVLITFGYILWGCSTMSFALISPANISHFAPTLNAVQLAALLVIIMDCVMTFFGSTANDAAFNAWVTDASVPANRGRVQAVLAVLPLLSMLIVFGALDRLTQQGQWSLFFTLIGGLTILAGLINIPLMKESRMTVEKSPFWPKIAYGFKVSVMREHPPLYVSLAAMLILSTATQIYMPYLIIYIQNYLKINNYALVLGIVLLGASLISVLSGRLIDRWGKSRSAWPAAAIQLLGLLGMYLLRSQTSVILAGLVMMSGFMILIACINGLIQDGLPEGMAGRFQGVRMIFAVMLPMIIGPFIGSAVIKNSAESYMELGVSKQVPTPAIFLSAALALLLIVLPLLWLSLHRVEQIPTAIVGPSVSGELRPLESSYAADIDRNCPLPEYPRPQLSRAETSWKNLNGIWRYAIRKGSLPSAHDETIVMPQADGDILVPYSPESLLSTVQRRLLPDEVLWYERILEEEDLPEIPQNGRLLLHCGAVDQLCHVYLNGKRAGEHEGGYLAFTCDITDWIQPGSNRLTLAVTDPSQKGERAYGKQTLHRGKIWYSTSSGIWQTIWLEAVPEAYIADIKLIPNCQSASIRMELDLRGGQAVAPLAEHKNTLSLHIFMPSAQITKTFTLHQSTPARLILEVAVPNMRCWSPEDPYLYHYELRWGQDTVKAYFAMRSFGIMKDEAGIPRLSLNGRPYMQIGILDQGYWSDGMYTPPSEQAMVDDILRMKALGFNMLRKHIKIEAARWYHHCDRLGMLVWQDMVSGGGPYKTSVIALLPFFSIFLKDTKNYRRFGRASASSRLIFEEEVRATIQQLYSVPSIALWVPFNEAWGQFDAARIRDLVHELDPSRPIDHASGWHDQGAGDLKSRHVYFKKIRLQADRGGRPLALTEFGGFSYAVPGHTSNSKEYGYKPFQTLEAYQQGVLDLMEKLQQQPPLLAATVYTQVSDVEDEINGLLTYDRRVSKWPEGSPAAERLLAIHLRLRQFPDGSSPLKQDPPKNDG